MSELVELFLTFAKIGGFTFGGGYAMLPILQRDLEEKRHWVTSDELMDYFAIGQCTPGVIALNVSTFVGSKLMGIPGALTASIGFLTIPIILIILIAMFLQNFATLTIVRHAFAGIRVCVCVLIVEAVLRLWKKSIVDVKTLILYIAVFALAVFSKLLPVSLPTALLVVASGVFGILFAGKEVKA